MKVTSWGRLSTDFHRVIPLDRTLLSSQIKQSLPAIAYGMGRSYGDVCLNPQYSLWKTSGLDRLIEFNSNTGYLRCEPGVLLKTIQQLFVSQGWMLPVTPGTQWVTVGGAIANDVHGKNHHLKGTFGHHIQFIRLMRTDGQIIDCTPNQNVEWFNATIGGMGLTGLISEVGLQLQPVPSPWLNSETIPYTNLEEFFDLVDSSEPSWAYTVSWIDCLSKKDHRGLFMRANHAERSAGPMPKKSALMFPITPPISMVNQWSLKLFNELYFHKNQRKKGETIVHYEPFFYPLDHIQEWNKLYGRKGFYQYQCVIPTANREAIKDLLNEIAAHREGSFLAVLKTFGDKSSRGLMSFVQPGVTLALDFANKGQATLKLFDKLDQIVHEASGRLYCAKNAYMSKNLFESGYPKLSTFLNYRDPGISSGLSRRLMGI